MKLLRFLLPIIFACTLLSFMNVDLAAGEECSAYEFIFARGSGQELNDVDYKDFKKNIQSQIEDDISFYELGTAKNGYPAKSVDFKTALQAYISAGKSYEYGASVERGVTELIARVRNESRRCKDKKFVLTGYSQGAQVVDESIKYLNSDRIVYVANFGDPKLYLPEGKSKTACKNIGLSSYRVYVPDCNVEEGVLSAIKPYTPSGYDGKLGVWCNNNDFMCGSSLNIFSPMKGHTTYIKNENTYKKLATIIKEKIDGTKSSITDAEYKEANNRDILIIFEYGDLVKRITNFHDKMISDGLRDELIELTKQGHRVSIYSSYISAEGKDEIKEVVPFTSSDIGEKINKVNIYDAFYQPISLGGQYYNIYSAIRIAATSADWQNGNKREIYAFLDKNNNTSTSNDGTTREEALKIAKENNIKVSFLYDDECNGSNCKIKEESNTISLKQKAKSIAKTYRINLSSAHTLVVVNGNVYGLSSLPEIIITDLDPSRENEIIFIGFDKNGKIKEREVFIYEKRTVRIPDTGFTP